MKVEATLVGIYETLTVAMQGTKTSEESSLIANCNGLLVCRRIASKLTNVLQPDSISHNLNLESDPGN